MFCSPPPPSWARVYNGVRLRGIDYSCCRRSLHVELIHYSSTRVCSDNFCVVSLFTFCNNGGILSLKWMVILVIIHSWALPFPARTHRVWDSAAGHEPRLTVAMTSCPISVRRLASWGVAMNVSVVDDSPNAARWNANTTVGVKDLPFDSNFAFLIISLLVGSIWYIYITFYNSRLFGIIVTSVVNRFIGQNAYFKVGESWWRSVFWLCYNLHHRP